MTVRSRTWTSRSSASRSTRASPTAWVAAGRDFYLADRAMVSGSTSADVALAACLDRLQPVQPEAPERGYRARPETAIPTFVEPPCIRRFVGAY